MFFMPRTRPLELTAQGVRALRPSLNTPVVATSDLPVGPACAAILVHVEAGLGLQISVGVRSLGCESVALYGFDGPIGASVVSVALDAALSFAESMGFLFDDDIVDDDEASREKAVLRWRELIGDALGSRPAVAARPAEPVELFESDGGELTDPPLPAEGEVDIRMAPEAPFELSQPSLNGNEGVEFQPSEPQGMLALSKFRVQPSASESSPPAEAPAPRRRAAAKRALGRMRLVKRRTPEPLQDERRAWLIRLLTSF